MALEQDIITAAQAIRQGSLVAFPTETVYGLGANALDAEAVANIFELKGRPRFDPLIVHVANIEMAKTLVHWNDAADRLASAFWPGPMTMVLPLRQDAGISPLVTAGLDTLAVRAPAHDTARSHGKNTTVTVYMTDNFGLDLGGNVRRSKVA